MRLKSKFLNVTLDDIPDSEGLKALTNGEQVIDGQQTFIRAPRVLNVPATPNTRDLVTRGQVQALVESVIARSRKLDWDFSGGPILVIDPTPAKPEPKPSGPRCRIEYRGKYSWVTVIEWECSEGPLPEGEQATQRQSYEAPDASYHCIGKEVRKVVFVREPYEVCE